MRVRHSTFRDCTGVAVRQTTKHDWIHGIDYPATVVEWDNHYLLDTVMANYNLVFIVPAVTRVV